MPARHRHKTASIRRRQHQARRHQARPLSPEARHFEITAKAAKRHGVPPWLLWGIAGAESTWGKGGSNIFGLLAAAEGVNTADWKASSNQAAKTLAGLKRQYGSWAAAVAHYSGNSYTIAHPTQIAAEHPPAGRSKPLQGGKYVDIETPLGNVPFPGPDLNFNSPFGPLSPLNKLPDIGPSLPGVPSLGSTGGTGGALGIPGEVLQASTAVTSLITTLLDIHFWIRLGEAIAALILLYMGLHALTGQGPSTGAVRRYAEGAAFKRLPPKTRVKAD